MKILLSLILFSLVFPSDVSHKVVYADTLIMNGVFTRYPELQGNKAILFWGGGDRAYFWTMAVDRDTAYTVLSGVLEHDSKDVRIYGMQGVRKTDKDLSWGFNNMIKESNSVTFHDDGKYHPFAAYLSMYDQNGMCLLSIDLYDKRKPKNNKFSKNFKKLHYKITRYTKVAIDRELDRMSRNENINANPEKE